MFSVRVTCSCREQPEIDPQALPPRAGWCITRPKLAALRAQRSIQCLAFTRRIATDPQVQKYVA
jgi:hypothetical protein